MSEQPEEPKGKRVGYYVILFALMFSVAGALSYLFGVFDVAGLPEHEGVAGQVGSIVGAIIFPALIGMGVGYMVGQRV